MSKFVRKDYLKDAPKAVIDLIKAAFRNGELDDEEWGDDVADALSAAQKYAAAHPNNIKVQEFVLTATGEWNEEGDIDATIAALDDAFRIV